MPKFNFCRFSIWTAAKPWLLALSTTLFLGLDIVLFSNCIVPGHNQSPQIVEQGQSDLGISGHTGGIIAPIEIGGYYRQGLGAGTDFGLRLHNWVNMPGVLLDGRKSLWDNRAISQLSLGAYHNGTHRLVYFSPALMRSKPNTYLGIRLNTLASNAPLEFEDSGEARHYYGVGPSAFSGFRVGKKLFFSGGWEAGAIAIYNKSAFWPILQVELGLGYRF